MREFIARLVRCGMPRDIAVHVCRAYVKKGDWKGLHDYVYEVELEVQRREDDDW